MNIERRFLFGQFLSVVDLTIHRNQSVCLMNLDYIDLLGATTTAVHWLLCSSSIPNAVVLVIWSLFISSKSNVVSTRCTNCIFFPFYFSHLVTHKLIQRNAICGNGIQSLSVEMSLDYCVTNSKNEAEKKENTKILLINLLHYSTPY